MQIDYESTDEAYEDMLDLLAEAAEDAEDRCDHCGYQVKGGYRYHAECEDLVSREIFRGWGNG